MDTQLELEKNQLDLKLDQETAVMMIAGVIVKKIEKDKRKSYR